MPVDEHGDDGEDAEERDDPGAGEREAQSPHAAPETRGGFSLIPRVRFAHPTPVVPRLLLRGKHPARL